MFNSDARRAIEAVADSIGVPRDALLAVVDVESNGVAFTNVGGRPLPVIRWEGHYFDRLVPAEKRAAARAAGLADPKAGKVKNGTQAQRYDILKRASAIDLDAAISSISWGVGQVMGAHWKVLGYTSPSALRDEACSGLSGQVRLMAQYIMKFNLADELRRHDWAGFARGYNGPAYAKDGYHTKMAAAYEAYAGAQAPKSPAAGMLRLGSKGRRVRELQQLLARAGLPVQVDGDYGPTTKAAVRKFQKAAKLTMDGVAGPETMAALMRFRTSPEETPGEVSVLKTKEAPKGGAVVLTGAVIATAKDEVTKIADQLPVGGFWFVDALQSTLYGLAGILVFLGLLWVVYGYIKSQRTVEQPA